MALLASSMLRKENGCKLSVEEGNDNDGEHTQHKSANYFFKSVLIVIIIIYLFCVFLN